MSKDKANPVEPKRSETPKRAMPFLKGKQTFQHHLVELLPATGMVNKSHNPKKPEIESSLNHKHWFHSVNQRGVEQVKTEEKNRHFHYVTIHWDKPKEDGTPTIEVGPAMRKYETIELDTRISEEKPVGWFEIKGNQKVRTEDRHTHVGVYRGSQVIVERGANKVSDEEAARIFGAPAPDKNIAGLEIHE